MSTKIEWTDQTWNPTTGCDRVSPGCDNCYAMTLAKRLKAMGQPDYQVDGDPRTSGPGFGLQTHAHRLDAPLHWRKPRRVFVNSMSDLFHPSVPDEFIASVFDVMACHGPIAQHTFQVLTKRPQRMESLLCKWAWNDGYEGSPNVWLGTSIESARYRFRADHLRGTPAAVRFLSIEPLVAPLGTRMELLAMLEGMDWVIVGGESGPGARPMHSQWARDIRDACVFLEIPFFFKQWGAWGPAGTWRGPDHHLTIDGRLFKPGQRLGMDHMMQPAAIHRWGKKAAGRVLDGRTWDEYPESG